MDFRLDISFESPSGAAASASAAHATEVARIRFVGNFLSSLSAGEEEMILQAAAGRSVVFDFGGLGRMNSVGLRGLVRLSKALASVTELTYVRCVPQILEQFSMLPDFLRYGKVTSVLLSESCPSGHIQTEAEAGGSLHRFRELQLGTEIRLGDTGPLVTPSYCRTCGNQLERDDVDEILFGFLKAIPLQSGQEQAS
jgi:anti-anti-sigma regulatory factor